MNLRIGALAPKLSVQLREQGLRLGVASTRASQDDMDAITRLHVRGVITDAEHAKAARRITNRIARLATKVPRQTRREEGK